jgi:hypothetical protein
LQSHWRRNQGYADSTQAPNHLEAGDFMQAEVQSPTNLVRIQSIRGSHPAPELDDVSHLIAAARKCCSAVVLVVEIKPAIPILVVREERRAQAGTG